jgi:hypothetical protein
MMYIHAGWSDYVVAPMWRGCRDHIMFDINTVRDVPLGRGGKYGQLTVECERFADNVRDHVFSYGLRQILNDAIADKTDDEGNDLGVEALVAKATKRLDTLYSGELRSRTAEREPIDPVEAVMHREARRKITTMAKATPEYAATKGEKDRVLATLVARNTATTWDEAIAKYIAAVPGLRKAAERIVREQNDVPEGIV